MNDSEKITRRHFLISGGAVALMLLAGTKGDTTLSPNPSIRSGFFVQKKTYVAEMQMKKLQEMAKLRELPFSFVYNGKPSSQLLKDWSFTEETQAAAKSWLECRFLYIEPDTKFQVECACRICKDFPAVEWVLYFQNNGANDTPIIENIQALDISFDRKTSGSFLLHHALGSNAAKDDFAPIDDILTPNTPMHLAPVGGRSSSATALPFFNLEAKGEGGVMIGIGWTGQWAASIQQTEGASVAVQAGMEVTHLKLHPGECIRSPRISLLFWQGTDHMAGHNLFRRFVLSHHSPHIKGKTPLLPFSGGASGPPDEANTATEKNQIAYAKSFIPYGVEYYWIDAGWYEGGWPNGVGNWVVRKNGFPNGMLPLTEALKKMGMKGLILWFEPERVFQGTELDRDHSDWIIHLPGNPNGLLNLGNDSARQWLTDHISSMIQSQGISVYRQDFNIDPLPFWRANDTPDRQGITEIKHVEGLYAYWDELLRRHPGLLIDNCASGGRRIDMETIDRCVVLWRSDYQYYEPEGMQSHTYGISHYIPTTSTGCGYPDAYSFRSSINSGVGLWVPWTGMAPYDVYSRYLPWVHWDPSAPFPLETAKTLAKEFKRIRELFFGDFYPLTPYSVASDVWMAIQFHRDDRKEGMVLAYRRASSLSSTITLQLHGLMSRSLYAVQHMGDAEDQIYSGDELAGKLLLTAENAPEAILITYRKLD